MSPVYDFTSVLVLFPIVTFVYIFVFEGSIVGFSYFLWRLKGGVGPKTITKLIYELDDNRHIIRMNNN